MNDHASWTSPHGTPLPPIGGRTLLMGILNVTPDSFSDGGAWIQIPDAVKRAHQMAADGADVIDVGGESTRPGASEVSAQEEEARVVPVIRRLKRELPQVPLSIDTYKADVAAAAVAAGADMINDVQGLKHGLSQPDLDRWARAASGDDAAAALPKSPMARVAAEANCPVFIMHNGAGSEYSSFWDELIRDLRTSVALARAAGVEDRQIWLDPGFGFGKKPPHNLEVVKNLDRLGALGFPVLLGTSRKSTIGQVLDRDVEHRLEGTAATVVWGIAKGCQMVRIHDIAPIALHARMADAVKLGLDYPHG